MILPDSTKNYDHMKFGYRVLALTNRQIILDQFLPFYVHGRSTNQFFYTSVPKTMLIWCLIADLWL